MIRAESPLFLEPQDCLQPLISRPEVSLDGRTRFASARVTRDARFVAGGDGSGFDELCTGLEAVLSLPRTAAGQQPVIIMFHPTIDGYTSVEMIEQLSNQYLRATGFTVLSQPNRPDTIAATRPRTMKSGVNSMRVFAGNAIQFGWVEQPERVLAVTPDMPESLSKDYLQLHAAADAQKNRQLGRRIAKLPGVIGKRWA